MWREAEIWLPYSLPTFLTHCGVKGWWEREEVHRHEEPKPSCELPITVVCWTDLLQRMLGGSEEL